MANCEVCGIELPHGVGRPRRRCPAHATKYGADHQRLRKLTLAQAYGTACARCGGAMWPGQDLDLDHAEDGGYLGWSHSGCNRRAGADKRNHHRPRKPREGIWQWYEPARTWVPQSREW